MRRDAVLLSAVLFGLLLVTAAFAHQPRIVAQETTVVQNPEVSQAFYGELNGTPSYFTISSDKPFALYIGLLVPDVPGAGKDVSAEVRKDGLTVYKLDGTNFSWTAFYEEFGGDNYWQGPELKQTADAGTYFVEVRSPDNKGKYVIAIGEKEEFPAGEMLNTLILLPKLKQDFFEKPAYTAYFNMIGVFIFGPIILLIAAILAAAWFLRRRKKQAF